MVHRLVLACLLCLAPASLLAQEPGTVEALQALLAKRLAAEERPTCALAGFAGEKTVIAKACTEGASAPTLVPESFVEIGSVSKAVTGLVLADMVGKGEIRLEEPASALAPPGAKLPAKGAREIRIRDLASQSSGLPRMPPGFQSPDQANPYAHFDVAALYEALAGTQPAREPGAGYEYSNFGFMWLSELLGRRARSDFEALAKERVFAPLGMAQAAVRLPPEAMKRLAQGHDPDRRPVRPWDVPVPLAGVGGIRATTLDMMKLAEALAGRRPSALDEAIGRSREALFVSGRTTVAYAWAVIPRPAGDLYWHNGGTAGFHTMLAWSPTARRAAWVVADSPANLDDFALHLVDPALPAKQRRVAIALERKVLEEYVGRYELRPGFEIAFTREGGRLFSQATGQPRFEVFAEATDRFFLRAFEAQLHFRRSASGEVEGLTLLQGGREMPAKRLP